MAKRIKIVHARWTEYNKPDRQASANGQWRRWQRLYEIDGNPIYAWQAYKLAREYQLEMPSWVTEYFDMAAMNLEWALDHPPKKGHIHRTLVEALGFVPGGVENRLLRTRAPKLAPEPREKDGSFNPFAQEHDRDLGIVESVRVYEMLLGNRNAAKRRVAAARGLSKKTVERALAKFPAHDMK